MKEIIILLIVGVIGLQLIWIFGSNPIQESNCVALQNNDFNARLETAIIGYAESCRLDINGYTSYPTQQTVAILISKEEK